MKISVVTLFPSLFESFLASSLLAKAIAAVRIRVDFVDPRRFTDDKHHSVDDAPFGGGEGMVLKPDPVVAAIESIASAKGPNESELAAPHRVLLSPRGAPLKQRDLARLAGQRRIVLVCGRYEGFDERIGGFVDEELSLGDFVLNGGEVAAMAIIDGVARLLPGVLGNEASLLDESHADGLLEYPQYTRPRDFRGQPVPEVLLSGDHERIRRWRRQQMLMRTRASRPDLWAAYVPSEEDSELLREVDAQRGGQVPGVHSQGDGVGEAAGEGSQRQAYVALLHHPVYDRDHRVVTTALTNLDLHDIARAARTYALAGYFIVTPLDSQRDLARRILSHWIPRPEGRKAEEPLPPGRGSGSRAERAEALGLVEVASDLAAVLAEVERREGWRPLTVATTAATREGQVGLSELRARWQQEGGPLLLLLGTGWGLTAETLASADLVLAPLRGPVDYNHLSVRSAAAILLDRLFGLRQEHGSPRG